MATVYNEIQKKLDRLEKLEAGNRARSKKYLDKIKALGKRQISIILDESTIDELTRRRDESIKAGTPLTFGDLISLSINSSVNIAKKVMVKDVNPVSQDDVNIDGKPNWKTQPAEYRKFIDDILREIPPGQWKLEADKLNQKGILTPQRGLPWKANNLRMAYNKFKKT